MEEYQLAVPTLEADDTLPPILTIGIGRLGSTLFFGADPATGLISVSADGVVDLQFDGDDFDLITELLQRALGN